MSEQTSQGQDEQPAQYEAYQRRRAARAANRAAARSLLDDPLLTVREAAAERGIAVSTFWRDVKRGILPSPIYPTPKTPRWRRSAIRPDQ